MDHPERILRVVEVPTGQKVQQYDVEEYRASQRKHLAHLLTAWTLGLRQRPEEPEREQPRHVAPKKHDDRFHRVHAILWKEDQHPACVMPADVGLDNPQRKHERRQPDHSKDDAHVHGVVVPDSATMRRLRTRSKKNSLA